MKPLTTKMQRFAEAYDGNGTEAARAAGYTGSVNVLAQTSRRLLRDDRVVTAIKSREKKEVAPLIASRQERQAFWTAVMKDSVTDMSNRLKASELLGRSCGDFINVSVDATRTYEELILAAGATIIEGEYEEGG